MFESKILISVEKSNVYSLQKENQTLPVTRGWQKQFWAPEAPLSSAAAAEEDQYS